MTVVAEAAPLLHRLGYDAQSDTAERCFRREAGLGADDDLLAALRHHASDAEGSWLRRSVQAARQVLALDGKRLAIGSDGVRGELERAARGETIPHHCDAEGVLLHPFMLETLLALTECAAVRVDVLRASHGKYQKIDDVTVCHVPDGVVSSHFLGHAVDFYAVGPSLDALARHADGEEAWWEAVEHVVRPYWDSALRLPPGYWIVFPLGLGGRYQGLRHGSKFFSNERHVDHVHIGLNMNVPRLT